MLVELRTKALDITVNATPTRWWDTNKETLGPWGEFKPMLKARFGHNPKYV